MNIENSILRTHLDIASIQNEHLRHDYLATPGPLKTLDQGDSTTFEESWEVITGQYPATLESARDINKQLSKQ